MRQPILIFDGECNFCRACVRWLVRRDPAGDLHYATLESEVGKRILREHGANPEALESVVLVIGDEIHWQSEAVLRAIRLCRPPWSRLALARVIPRSLRDWGYRRVSKNRPFISRALGTIHHRWEPPEDVRDRFLSY